jgi:hypothetical protein
VKGGLARGLTSGLIRRYRTTLHRKVEARRTLPAIGAESAGSLPYDEDGLFQLVLDAVSIREIQRVEIPVGLRR